MAKLFLSYSRKDETKARRLCDWLEREGHDVWRDDEDIGGGASFSSEIEKALKDCDAVVVLWSAESVQSAWVRDEAGYGRDAGKLIPLSLDLTELPLGFRQFQAISISGWKARGEPPGGERIRQAIARVAKVAPPPPTLAVAGHRGPAFALGRWRLAGAAVALIAVIAAAIFLWPRWTGDRQVTITVMASPRSPDPSMAADYANAAAADMAAFLPRRFDRATVIAPADAAARPSGYRMEIFTDPHGAGVNATLTLSDQDGYATLWSQNWSVADASAAELKADISAAASKAALCLTDATGGSNRLSQPALGLYLTGCSWTGSVRLPQKDFVGMFERITSLAPKFGPGWEYLALSRSWIAQDLRGGSPTAYASAVKAARDAIAVARKLNPHSGKTYDAEFHLISNDTFRALQVLEKGAEADPNDGRVQMHLAEQYLSVGRMSDSVQAAQRGIELEPGSPFTSYQYILALIYSGQFSKAKNDIAEARKKWPNDFSIDLADFSYQSRYGDPRAALQLLPKIAQSSDAEMAPFQKVLEARLNPTPGKIDDAIRALESQPPSDDVQNDILLALGGFGRVDQLYRMLDDPRFQSSIERDALFRPDFAAVRADPRFMKVAARLGLVRYWRTTGYWPDFCSRERLPYDCKTEAAKYPG